MNHRIPVLLDGDPGHDDAIAWMLAATGLDIRGVSSVAGNQTIEKTTRNALRICTLLGIKAPVAMGLARPLLSEALTAPSVHGVSGLDGPALPEPDREAAPERAPEQMARLLRESAEPLTIVATAPLTNVAALLLAHPELKANIAGISLMGGGLAHGNWTPAAEFNILADSEAADVVFRSGLPITMAGLDVTEQALLYPEDFARIRAVGNPVAETVAGWLDFFFAFHRTKGYAGAPVHDAVAVCALLRPDLLHFEDWHVTVETQGAFCRGATVGDRRTAPNARVITGIDREGFAELLTEAVRTYG